MFVRKSKIEWILGSYVVNDVPVHKMRTICRLMGLSYKAVREHERRLR